MASNAIHTMSKLSESIHESEQETLKQTRTRKLHNNLNWNCPKPSGYAVAVAVANAAAAHKYSASISQNSRSIVSIWVIIFANARLILFSLLLFSLRNAFAHPTLINNWLHEKNKARIPRDITVDKSAQKNKSCRVFCHVSGIDSEYLYSR